ncbi:MAG: DEAD/DEAH box helicase, partial [Quisquiliibacterium sp.]
MSVQAATQSAALRLEHAGVCLTLLPQRAVLIEHERALLVSDLHLGKAATFRKLGVPVPEGTTLATLARLDALLEQH